jgi:heterodisulfide reductase subunit C
MALRKVSHELGYFTDSEKGRQQFALKRVIGHNILQSGYCVNPDIVSPFAHPEQGPVWEWYYSNTPEVLEKLGGNYKQDGPGILRKVPEESLEELDKIFEVTGCYEMFEAIEKNSQEKAGELGLKITPEGIDNEYFAEVYTANNGSHNS